MADLVMKLVADLTKVKNDVNKFLKEKFTLDLGANVSGGKAAGGGAEAQKTGKKQTGLLGSIVKGLVPLIALGKILDTLKVLELINALLSFLTLFFVLRFPQLLKDLIAPPTNELNDAIDNFETALKSGDPGAIKETREELGKVLLEAATEAPNVFKRVFGELGKVLDFLGSVGAFAQKSLSKFGNKIKDFIFQTEEAEKGVGENLGKMADDAFVTFDEIKENASASMDELSTDVSKGINIVADDIKDGQGRILRDNIDMMDQLEKNNETQVSDTIETSDTITKQTTTFKEKFIKLWGSIVTAIADKINDLISRLTGGFFGGGRKSSPAPGSQATFNPATGTFTRADEVVQDAIITKRGEVIKTDPNDTIIATKNLGGLGGGNTFIFNGFGMDEAMERVKRELGTDINTNSGRF